MSPVKVWPGEVRDTDLIPIIGCPDGAPVLSLADDWSYTYGCPAVAIRVEGLPEPLRQPVTRQVEVLR